MQGVVKGSRALAGRSLARAQAAMARLAQVPEPFDAEESRARFEAAFQGRFAA
jgi:beta-N-acetylhexosaminidase